MFKQQCDRGTLDYRCHRGYDKEDIVFYFFLPFQIMTGLPSEILHNV